MRRSIGAPPAAPSICSGARYAGLPRMVPARVSDADPRYLATPKSSSLTPPLAVSRMFDGVTSRWRISSGRPSPSAQRVHVVERAADLARDPGGDRRRHRAADRAQRPQRARQRRPLDVLQHQEEIAAIVDEVVHLYDVRVVQHRRDARLFHEELDELRIRAVRRLDTLDHDVVLEPGRAAGASLPDLGHAAAPERLEQAITSELRARAQPCAPRAGCAGLRRARRQRTLGGTARRFSTRGASEPKVQEPCQRARRPGPGNRPFVDRARPARVSRRPSVTAEHHRLPLGNGRDHPVVTRAPTRGDPRLSLRATTWKAGAQEIQISCRIRDPGLLGRPASTAGSDGLHHPDKLPYSDFKRACRADRSIDVAIGADQYPRPFQK